jgi:hypothetical protein
MSKLAEFEDRIYSEGRKLENYLSEPSVSSQISRHRVHTPVVARTFSLRMGLPKVFSRNPNYEIGLQQTTWLSGTGFERVLTPQNPRDEARFKRYVLYGLIPLNTRAERINVFSAARDIVHFGGVEPEGLIEHVKQRIISYQEWMEKIKDPDFVRTLFRIVED